MRSLFEDTIQLAKKYGLRPQRSRGQNFLIDGEIVKEMIKAASLTKKDHVLEVGGGLGTLTKALAEQAGQVTVVEIDKALIPVLSGLWARYSNLKIIQDDILSINFKEIVTLDYKIVASLPYNITSLLLRNILEHQIRPSLAVLLVQREVAERITALPGRMSILAVSVQYFAKAEIIQTVSKEAFWPKPAVDSAIIRLISHKKQPVVKDFFKVVKAGFAHPRKQLKNNLKFAFKLENKEVDDLLKQIGSPNNVRAQNLSLEQWKSLSKAVAGKPIL